MVVGPDCVSEYEVRECEGTDILRTEPCGGQCGQDYILLQAACVDWWDSWECGGERISKHRPCQGECYQDYQEGLRLLLAGECHHLCWPVTNHRAALPGSVQSRSGSTGWKMSLERRGIQV